MSEPEFLAQMRDAWTSLHGGIEPTEPYFVTSALDFDEPKTDQLLWWLSAKSQIRTCPEFALILIMESADPSRGEGEDTIENWSEAQVVEFANWARALPGWGGGPLFLISATGSHFKPPWLK